MDLFLEMEWESGYPDIYESILSQCKAFDLETPGREVHPIHECTNELS